MKKFRLFLIIFILLLTYIRVDALEIGYSYDAHYDGAYLIETNTTLGIKSGRKMALVVEHDNANNVGKVDVTISKPSNIELTTDGSHLHSGDKITGSGNNYTIQVNSSEEEEGVAVFYFKFPTVTSVTDYTITLTAKEYDKSNELIKSKTAKYKFYVLAKKGSCEDNTNITVTSSAGEVKKASNMLYNITTKGANIDFTIVPESSNTTVYYWGYGTENKDYTFDKAKKLSDGKTGTIKLDYGLNQVIFELETECSLVSKANAAVLEKCDNLLNIDYEDYNFGGDNVIISVKRTDTRSKVNTLSKLSITGATINFKPDLKNYIVSVPYSVSKITISSSLTDSKSSYVKDYGNRTVDLKEGLNTVEIKVKAENGSKATYTLKITRDKNNDASLKSLAVDGKEVTLKKGILIYSASVLNDVKNPTITAVANDKKAKVQIDKFEELYEGSNIINITVTAANGTKNIYELDIYREKVISENSKLKNLVVKNYSLDFSPEKLDYTLKIDKDVEKLDFEIETDHQKATYKIIGNKDLENESIVKIKVIAQDGKTTTTYQIKIEKEKMKFNILFAIVPIAVIVPVLLVLLIVKIKGNKNVISGYSNRY